MVDSLLSKPTLVGIMQESPQYRTLSIGQTDSILLVGHADAELMYEPYRVTNIRTAVNFLAADTKSPLLRGLLEAYNAGCKDIWIYPAAPMSEYVDPGTDRFTANFASGVSLGLAPNLTNGVLTYLNLSSNTTTFSDQGTYNFYQKWYERLYHAYARLLTWDFPDYIVPIEAAFYYTGNVDFATQLVNYCANAFATTGSITLGVLGTRITNFTLTDITAMTQDTRLSSFGDNGKFLTVVVGEGLVTHSQMSTTYPASLAVQVASLMATASLGRSIAGLKLPGVSSLIGNDLPDDQIQALSLAKFNPVTRTQRGKRGLAFEARLVTDNTMASTGSDYWSLAQMRITSQIINTIRGIGYKFIGEIAYETFKTAVQSYMQSLKAQKLIVDYMLKIEMLNLGSKANVTIGITPITGIRNIYFSTMVGPGN